VYFFEVSTVLFSLTIAQQWYCCFLSFYSPYFLTIAQQWPVCILSSTVLFSLTSSTMVCVLFEVSKVFNFLTIAQQWPVYFLKFLQSSFLLTIAQQWHVCTFWSFKSSIFPNNRSTMACVIFLSFTVLFSNNAQQWLYFLSFDLYSPFLKSLNNGLCTFLKFLQSSIFSKIAQQWHCYFFWVSTVLCSIKSLNNGVCIFEVSTVLYSPKINSQRIIGIVIVFFPSFYNPYSSNRLNNGVCTFLKFLHSFSPKTLNNGVCVIFEVLQSCFLTIAQQWHCLKFLFLFSQQRSTMACVYFWVSTVLLFSNNRSTITFFEVSTVLYSPNRSTYWRFLYS
jgi:hypothetical protein